MGVYFVMGPCAGCGQVFTFNPHKVPSIRIQGKREPICKGCIDRANPEREKKGLDPIEILPGAYEPADESEGL